MTCRAVVEVPGVGELPLAGGVSEILLYVLSVVLRYRISLDFFYNGGWEGVLRMCVC